MSEVKTSFEKKVGFEDITLTKVVQAKAGGDVEFEMSFKAWVNDKSWPESILFPAKFYGKIGVNELVESLVLKQGLVVSRLRDEVRKGKFAQAKVLAGKPVVVDINEKRDRRAAITPESTVKRLKAMGLTKEQILKLIEGEFAE